MRAHPGQLALLVLAVVLLPACGGSGAPREAAPATVEHVAATGEARLHLTATAAGRLGLQTAPVRAAGAGRLLVPYSAVLYGTDGATWTYARAAPLVFVRRAITVVAIEGDVAELSAGPPAGTAVVSVGAAELRGIEYGVVG